MTIDCVLFDLGNTLISYFRADEFRPVLQESINRCCQVMADHDRVQDETGVFEHALRITGERPDLSVYPLAERFQVLFGQTEPLEPELVERLVNVFMQPVFATARPDPDAVPVLQALREQGIRTGIISNTPWGSPADVWHAELQRHGLTGCFDLVLFCVDVGWRKPHPAIFDHAVARMDLVPGQTLFVGDDLRWDVQGALEAGMNPVLIDRDAASSTTTDVPVIQSLPEVLDLVGG